MAQTISTNQAPNAKPNNRFLTLSTSWQTMITVDNYRIPVPGFGDQTRIAPGVAEITSPLTLSNISEQTQRVSVRIRSAGHEYVVAHQIPVEPNDVVYLPFNGQFLLSEHADTLEVRAESDAGVSAMISFTQGQAEENDPLGSI